MAQARILNDLLHLIYPETCVVCDRELSVNEEHICSFCQEDLIYTDFHLFEEESPMDKLFWGRVPVASTYAHIHFKKNAGAQRVLFNLKYKNNQQIGHYFGKEIGKTLKNSSGFKDAELLIPVPLHHKKAFLRGYNQSQALAEGISETLQTPVNTKIAIRKTHNRSQTKNNRFQRWENVDSIFVVKDTIREYKHIVLVDDVITTGSTLEALMRALLEKQPELRISVITLAIA